MRTLKKTLCLVLAVVMLLGIGVFSVSATNMKDDATIGSYYKEAVEIVTAVGALKGDENGNLNPQKELTRAEGAVLIARLSGVQDEGGKAPFNDTEAVDYWAGGAIAYCYYQGYIAGDGLGNFMPQQPLTGYAFEKMLLCALGYDAYIESMAGSGDTWTVATATLAKKVGISWSALNPMNTLTREQAAKLALNAMKADKVDYANRGVEINNPDGTTIRVNASSASNVTSKASMAKAFGDGANDDGSYNVQLGEELFNGDLKRIEVDGEDSMGRPANKWTYKSNEITVIAADPVATFSEKVGEGKVATDLAGYRVARVVGINLDNSDNYRYVNKNELSNDFTAAYIIGETDPNDKTAVNGAGDLSINAGNTVAKAIAKYTANGRLVEVYANDDNVITKILLVNYGVGKVSSVSTASNGNVTYTISGLGSKIDYADATSKDTIVLANAVAKDDYVTWTLDKDGVAYVYGTTKVEGAQSNFTTGKEDLVDRNGTALDTAYYKTMSNNNLITSVTVGGTKYPVAWSVRYAKTFDNNSDETKTLYLDQYGLAVYCDTKGNNKSNYAVVNAIVLREPVGLNTTYTAQATLAFADGTVSNVNVSKITFGDDGVEYKDKSAGGAGSYKLLYDNGTLTDDTRLNGDYQLQIVKYKTSGSNYEITYLKNYWNNGDYISGNTTALEKGKSKITVTGDDDIVGNNVTKYIVKTGDPAKYSAWTGFNSGKSYKDDAGMAVQAYREDSDHIVFLNASDSIETGSEKIFYATSSTITHTSSGGTDYYTMDGIFEGENGKSLTAKGDDGFDALKTISKEYLTKVWVDESGYLVTDDDYLPEKVALTAVNMDTDISDYVSNSARVFFNYTTTAGTRVYTIDDGKVEASDIETVANGDSYYVKETNDGNYIADVIYILKDAKKFVTDTLPRTLDNGMTYEITDVNGIQARTYYVEPNTEVTINAAYFPADARFVVLTDATLTLELTGTKDVDSHFDVFGGKLVINGDGAEIAGNSLYAIYGGDIYVNADTAYVTGPVIAYADYDDTYANLTISTITFSGNVVMDDGGVIGSVYNNSMDTSLVTVRGNLYINGGDLINTNEKAVSYTKGNYEKAGAIYVAGSVEDYSGNDLKNDKVITGADAIRLALEAQQSGDYASYYSGTQLLNYLLYGAIWNW